MYLVFLFLFCFRHHHRISFRTIGWRFLLPHSTPTLRGVVASKTPLTALARNISLASYNQKEKEYEVLTCKSFWCSPVMAHHKRFFSPDKRGRQEVVSLLVCFWKVKNLDRPMAMAQILKEIQWEEVAMGKGWRAMSPKGWEANGHWVAGSRGRCDLIIDRDAWLQFGSCWKILMSAASYNGLADGNCT